MRSSDLTERVFIQSPSTTRKSDGDFVNEYTTYIECWANVEIKKMETVDAEAKGTAIAGTITIRYRPMVELKDRITHNGQVYHIVSIEHEDRHWTIIEVV